MQVLSAASSGITGAIGATAPTSARLGTLIKAVRDLGPVGGARNPIPCAWATEYVDAQEMAVCSGHVIQFRSTKKQSGATGSPVQGWTWNLGAAMDEAQDSVEQGVYADVVARLRGGQHSPIMATATAKDSPAWRLWRDALSKNWTIHRLQYTDTPFVHDSHWEMMQEECSAREWQRRGLALDVGPERMVYGEWCREKNLVPIPPGSIDITSDVLAKWGSNYKLLAGHDPGKLCDVTLLFKCYRVPGKKRSVWFVVDEITTYQTTTSSHVRTLLKRLRSKWNCNILDRSGAPSEFGPQVFVRADPYSDSGLDDKSPDKSVYTTFRNAGIRILPAALKASVDKVKVARVPKEAGIDMVCSLFENVFGEHRLCVALDENKTPAAPQLVNAIELSERDGDGHAEKQKKDRNDMSHWPAATRYALWTLERPRFKELGLAA